MLCARSRPPARRWIFCAARCCTSIGANSLGPARRDCWIKFGEADKAVLSDAAYAARFKIAANPNLPLIRDLKKAGVEVFVCGQSLHELGFKAEEVAGEVPVADSAMLVLVNKQTDGYAYIPVR